MGWSKPSSLRARGVAVPMPSGLTHDPHMQRGLGGPKVLWREARPTAAAVVAWLVTSQDMGRLAYPSNPVTAPPKSQDQAGNPDILSLTADTFKLDWTQLCLRCCSFSMSASAAQQPRHQIYPS